MSPVSVLSSFPGNFRRYYFFALQLSQRHFRGYNGLVVGIALLLRKCQREARLCSGHKLSTARLR